METGNILGCAYVNALTRLVGTDLRPSAPYFIQDFGASVLEQALMTQAAAGDSLLLCDIGFHRQGGKARLARRFRSHARTARVARSGRCTQPPQP